MEQIVKQSTLSRQRFRNPATGGVLSRIGSATCGLAAGKFIFDPQFFGAFDTRIPYRWSQRISFGMTEKRRPWSSARDQPSEPEERMAKTAAWVSQRRSAGIGAEGEKAVGKLPRHIAKTWRHAAAMAADLTVVENCGESEGQDTDHGQHDEGTVLMGGGLLQVTIRGDGLKGLSVDRPAAATELMDEVRRNGAEIHVRGIEVGADDGSGLFGFYPRPLGLVAVGVFALSRFFRFRCFDLGRLNWTVVNLDALRVLHPNRLDDSHDTVGHGPVHLGHVPEL